MEAGLSLPGGADASFPLHARCARRRDWGGQTEARRGTKGNDILVQPVEAAAYASFEWEAKESVRLITRAFPPLAIMTCLHRHLQQKRAIKRGEQAAGGSDDSDGEGCLERQAGSACGQAEARAATPPPVITTTTTLSKSGQANKCA